jgi:F-type H+/Na+-transporting ATPase subunit alpha
LYLSPTLFELGVMPAVDVAKSVSRVGGAAQLTAYRAIAGHLKLGYSQFEELEDFSRFGTRLEENTRKLINHGERIRACLRQTQFEPVGVAEQIVILQALTAGQLDSIALDRIDAAQRALVTATSQIATEIRTRWLANSQLTDSDRAAITSVVAAALREFQCAP